MKNEHQTRVLRKQFAECLEIASVFVSSRRAAAVGDPMNGGGGKPQGPSDTDKQLAKLQMQKLQMEIKAASRIPEAPVIPPAPKPELVAPPPAQTSQDTEAAARELRKNVAKRKGIQRSRSSASLGAQSVLGGTSKLGTNT